MDGDENFEFSVLLKKKYRRKYWWNVDVDRYLLKYYKNI